MADQRGGPLSKRLNTFRHCARNRTKRGGSLTRLPVPRRVKDDSTESAIRDTRREECHLIGATCPPVHEDNGRSVSKGPPDTTPTEAKALCAAQYRLLWLSESSPRRMVGDRLGQREDEGVRQHGRK